MWFTKIFSKRIFLPTLISISGLFIENQNVQAQSSLHDSLRQMLAYFEQQAKDKKVRQAVKEAQALYTTDVISDSLARKLLITDSLLIGDPDPNKQMVLSFTETLVHSLQYLPPIKEHPDYAQGLNNLAGLYYEMGKYEKALPLYQQALTIRKKVLGAQHRQYTESLNNLANLYHSMGQYSQALPLYKQALAIRKKILGEEHPDYATSLSNLAALYKRMGEYDKALPLFKQTLAIDKKTIGEEHLDYAISLNNLANLYSDIGEKDNALSLYQQALAVKKKSVGEEHPYYATTLNDLALLYKEMGQYEKALPLYQQALMIDKKALGEEHPDYAFDLDNLGALYYTIGQYGKALPLHQQALAIRRKTLGEEHPDYATSLNNLANLYSDMGKKDNALSLYQQALAIRKKTQGEEHPSYAASLNHLAFFYQSIKEYEKALSLYQQALTIRKRILGEDHPGYALNLNDLAILYQDMGQYEKALPLFKQVLAIWEKVLGEEHPNYAYSLARLGLLYSALSNTKAIPLITQANNITLRHLSQTYSTLSEQGKMTFLNKESNRFSILPSLLVTQHILEPFALRQLYQNELSLKGMVLEDQRYVLNNIRKSSDTTTLQLYEQWLFNKALIGKQILLPIAKRLTYLDSLEEATTQLEQQLSRQANSFRNQQQIQAVTANDISRKLSKGEAAVEFIRFRLYNKKWTDSIMYAALVLLAEDSLIRFVPLFEEKQLQRLLKPLLLAKNTYAQYSALQKLYGGKSIGKSSSLTYPLYQLIWEPLEKNFEGIHTITFAPSGLLHRIAFQALGPDGIHLLMDKYELNQVLSTRSISFPAQSSPKSNSVSIWGDIDYSVPTSSVANQTGGESKKQAIDSSTSSFNFYASDTRGSRGGDWKSLPGTKREIERLGKLFSKFDSKITIDTGRFASEETFKALSGKSSQVVHLATHGFFLPVLESSPKTNNAQDIAGKSFTLQENPMFRSGLVLAGGNYAWKTGTSIPGREDGILTAYEISQMDLSSTELLVLSACETALGDLHGTEGVIGLQRAFKMAGVKQMVISMWRVPDKETTELMTLFYSHWLSGKSVRDALRTAQLKMKEKYPPFYWAAFVVVE